MNLYRELQKLKLENMTYDVYTEQAIISFECFDSLIEEFLEKIEKVISGDITHLSIRPLKGFDSTGYHSNGKSHVLLQFEI